VVTPSRPITTPITALTCTVTTHHSQHHDPESEGDPEMPTLVKIAGMTLNGRPYACPECATTVFNLEGRGPFDGSPAWGNCSSFHSWEDPVITVGTLKLILAARTGRQKAEDVDTFEITEHGNRLAGVLQPELTADDLKRVVRDVYWARIIKPGLRRRKNAAKRAIVRPIKRGTRNAVAAAQAAALEATWTAQAGGYEPDPDHTPEPINPCPACKGKGEHRIESRLHDTTRVRCAVCHGTGEID
jgi:hypothetical protein